jgi:hypothetical protein
LPKGIQVGHLLQPIGHLPQSIRKQNINNDWLLSSQTLRKAEEGAERLREAKVAAFRSRLEGRRVRAMFSSWTLLAADRVANHNAAQAVLQRLKHAQEVCFYPF